MSEELLDIVDELGKSIGVASRERVHRQGLLHCVTHVWLCTPQGELIFQRRALEKKTWPGKLDATVAGHVNAHETFEAAAIRELQEETGLSAKPEDLIFINRMRSAVFEPSSRTTHHALRQVYALHYDKPLTNLKMDPRETLGFEAIPLQTMLYLNADQASQYIPLLLEDTYLPVYSKIEKLVYE